MYKSIFIWKENKMNKDRKWAILTVCHQMMQPMQSVYDWSNCCSFSQTDNMKVISNRVLLHLYYAEVEVNYIVFFCSSLVPFVVRQTHRSILRHAWQVFTIYQRISHTSAKKPPGIILAVFQIWEKKLEQLLLTTLHTSTRPHSESHVCEKCHNKLKRKGEQKFFHPAMPQVRLD